MLDVHVEFEVRPEEVQEDELTNLVQTKHARLLVCTAAELLGRKFNVVFAFPAYARSGN